MNAGATTPTHRLWCMSVRATLSAVRAASARLPIVTPMSSASSKKRRATADAASGANTKRRTASVPPANAACAPPADYSATRPRRAAAAVADSKIAAMAALESATTSVAAMVSVATVAPASSASILRFASGESQSVLPSDLKRVPSELMDVQQPGVLRTPELYTQGVPTRHAKTRVLQFADAPEFTPNLTPSEILQAGAFGGYYFRAIASTVTGRVHVDAWREFPASWFDGLVPARHLTAPAKDARVNKYKVDCGQDLQAWETSSWIVEQDPFGWFQWFCRFYLGRRTADDARQIARWSGVCGAKGRWKTNLIHKVFLAGAQFDDASVSPVVRQTLLHWAYELNAADCEAYQKRIRAGATTSFIRADR